MCIKWRLAHSPMLLLFLGIGSGLPGCGKRTPYNTSFVVRNWSFHLKPVGMVDEASRASAAEIWRDLFPRMAKDEATLDLLNRLHGDHPVAFIVVDGKAARDNTLMTAPPPEGYAIVIRVGDLQMCTEKTSAGILSFRDIAYSRVTDIKDALQSPSAEATTKEPLPDEALTLAMDDYLLRHARDWVRGGPIYQEDEVPAKSEDRRADLNRRIEAAAPQAKAFYGKLLKGR